MKYHISPTTGNPNKCYAHKKPCPIGGESEHYGSREEARSAYERQQASAKANSFTSLKKVTKERQLSQEDLSVVDKYIATRKASGYLDPDTENDLRGSIKGSIAVSRHLEEVWGRKATFLDGGFSQRLYLPEPNQFAEVEVQGSRGGKIYFRVLDGAHKVGYGPHTKASWSVEAGPQAPVAVQRTVERYLAEYEKEQEEGRQRVAEFLEKKKLEEKSRVSEKSVEATSTSSFNVLVESLKGPKPVSLQEKYPAGTMQSFKCSACGLVDHNMRQESEEEGFDGYSPCCNKGMTVVTVPTPATYEMSFSSRSEGMAFVEANGMRSYTSNSFADGKFVLVGSIPSIS